MIADLVPDAEQNYLKVGDTIKVHCHLTNFSIENGLNSSILDILYGNKSSAGQHIHVCIVFLLIRFFLFLISKHSKITFNSYR